MTRAGGLRLLVAGQFLGALADSALLVVALQALAERHAPAWQAPALRVLFYGAYVLLAVFPGAVADAFAKRDVIAQRRGSWQALYGRLRPGEPSGMLYFGSCG